MGLFDKKFCELCNEKVNLLTRQKLEDGFLCSDCKKKLSCYSSGWSSRTFAQVQEHLQAREENKQKFAQFNRSIASSGSGYLVADTVHRWFYVAKGRDFDEGNPEIFDFNMITDFFIDEDYGMVQDSDGDGIPDSQDRYDNRTGEHTGGSFLGGLFGSNQNAGMNQSSNPYIRRDGSAYSNGILRPVTNVSAVIMVNHPFITELKLDLTAGTTLGEINRGYTEAMNIMQLCENIKNSNNQAAFQQAGFAPQGNPYAQQPMGANPYAQQLMGANPYAQQPMGANPYAQQPMGANPYAQQPMGANPYAQQPMGANPYAQQPAQQGGFSCPACGAPITDASVPFCGACGTKLR